MTNLLRLAEQAGWRTVFLGPSNSIDDILDAARKEKADLVGVSYRLTPETGERLLGDFAEAADELRARGVRFAFGGTPPVAARAEALGFFEQTFEGSESVELTLAYLRGDLSEGGAALLSWANNVARPHAVHYRVVGKLQCKGIMADISDLLVLSIEQGSHHEQTIMWLLFPITNIIGYLIHPSKSYAIIVLSGQLSFHVRSG